MSPVDRLGKYELLEQIRYGSLGRLYKAHDPLLKRVVALKVLLEEGLTEEVRTRFFSEARASARLSHPNIITVYDVGEDQGRLFVVMEYVEGEGLDAVIRRRAELPLELKLSAMLQICRGLGYAHRHGIVHADVKPGNVMLLPNATVKLLDFGLARIAATAQTTTALTATALTNSAYWAPERDSRRGDHRADIFSAGAVFYELAASARGRIAPGSPSLFAPDPAIPPDLAAVLERAMRREPDERYADMAGLEAALFAVDDRLRGEAHALRRRIAAAAAEVQRLQAEIAERLGHGPAPVSAPPAEATPLATLEVRWRDLQVEATRARARLDRATAWRPVYETALAHESEGDFAAAGKAFERVVAAVPEHTAAIEGLARVRQRRLDAETQLATPRPGPAAAQDATPPAAESAAVPPAANAIRSAAPGVVVPVARPVAGPSRSDAIPIAVPDVTPSTGEPGASPRRSGALPPGASGPQPPPPASPIRRDPASLPATESSPPARAESMPPAGGAAHPVVPVFPAAPEPDAPGQEIDWAAAAAPPVESGWRAATRARPRMAVAAAAALLLVVAGGGAVYYQVAVRAPAAQRAEFAIAREHLDASRAAATAANARYLSPDLHADAEALDRVQRDLAEARRWRDATVSARAAAQAYADAARVAGSAARSAAAEARARMLTDKRRAAPGEPEYEQALAQEQQGERHLAAGRFPEAAQAFLAAGRLFSQRGRGSAVASESPPGAAPPGAASSSPPAPAPPAAPAPAPGARPSPPVAARSATAPPTTSSDPDAEIRDVLRSYARAFQTKDLELLQRIRVSMGPDEVARHRSVFAQTRSYRIALQIDRIAIRGDEAEVRGRREDTIVTGSGESVRTPGDFRFELKKVGERWKIDRVR